METYPGQDGMSCKTIFCIIFLLIRLLTNLLILVLISYLKKQGSLTYREFLELYHDDIITSIITLLSSYPSWNELDYT